MEQKDGSNDQPIRKSTDKPEAKADHQGSRGIEKPEDAKKFPKLDAQDNSSVYCLVSKVEFSQLPPDMLQLIAGIDRPIPDDFDLPPPPPWLDIERIKKGQIFAQKHLYGVSYAQIISLLMLLSSPDSIKPLIYTGKSHTPNLAKTRYLATIVYIKSWYETDVWDPASEGYKNLKKIRAMHLTVRNRIRGLTVDEVHRLSDLEKKLNSSNSNLKCPLSGILKKTVDASEIGSCYPVYEKKENRIYFNQMEMAMTQFTLFSLVLLFPDKFGAKSATEEDLANFVHIWRYVGYMLGIEDEYNACTGDLETVKQRTYHTMEYFAKPMLLKANEEWEHMSRSAISGIGKFAKLPFSFESSMLYLYWVFEIKTPCLTQYFSWKEWIMFKILKYFLTSKYQIPGTTRFLNFTTKKTIEHADRKEYYERKLREQ